MSCSSFNLLISLVLAMRVSMMSSHCLCSVEIAVSIPALEMAAKAALAASMTQSTVAMHIRKKRQSEKEDEQVAVTRGQYCEGCSGPVGKLQRAFALLLLCQV